MTQVFISYAKEDAAAAQRLFRDLQSLDGIEPWLDEESLLPGMDWEDEILRAIKASQFVIVLLSPTAVGKSGFVQKELRSALERLEYFPPGEVFIIPVRIESCEPRYQALQRLHYVDLFPNWEMGITRIEETLKNKITTRLSHAFQVLPATWATQEEIKAWTYRYSADITAVDPVTVIEFLDKRYQLFKEELNALATILKIFKTTEPQSILLYLRRIHELIAESDNYPGEFFYANGLLLEGAKSLPGALRTMLLRDVFGWYIESIRATVGNSYPLCLALVEITKHYIVQKEGRYHSDVVIAREALSVLKKYDLLFAEIAIFYALRSEHYNIFIDLLPLFKNHISDVPANPLPYLEKDWLEIRRIHFGKEEYVHREGRSALMLFRSAEYLSRAGEEVIQRLGTQIRRIALRELGTTNRRWLKSLRSLTSEQSADFFSKLEALDDVAPAFLDEHTSAWEAILDLMDHPCGVRGRKVKIDGQIFGEEVPGDIYFRR